jgi:hypothetical protein
VEHKLNVLKTLTNSRQKSGTPQVLVTGRTQNQREVERDDNFG